MQITVSKQRIALSQTQSFALPALFAMFGMIMGSWASRIPGLRDGLRISHAELSYVLLCGGLGAVISSPLSARMMATLGGKKTVLGSGLVLLAVLIGIGLASSVPLLMLAVLSLGIAASCFDVGINSVATQVENITGKSALSKLHAWGCAGGLAGAMLGGLVAGMHVKPVMHFLMIVGPVGLVLWLGYSVLDVPEAAHTMDKKSFLLPRGPLALLGAIGFFGAMSEGSIADWSGVFLKDQFGVGDGFAPLALSGFSVMMLLARLQGDRLKEKYAARRLVCGGGAVSAIGLLCAVFAPNPYLALIGFALAGLGLALVFPFVFSAAGREGPVALAGVATMAYSGSLMGPPVVGTLAHGFGMQAAIGFIGLLSAVIAAVASRSALLK